MVRTRRSHCQGPGSIPDLESKIPTCKLHRVAQKKKSSWRFFKTSEDSRWQAMALAWHSASTAWLASGPRIKQLLGKGNCRNCLHNRLKPVKYQTVPGTEQAPSKDGFFSLCFLSCYSTGWHPALLAAHPDSSLLPSPDNRTSLSF